MKAKTCFVSMPVGCKAVPETGAVVDFDRVFNELVAPAIEDAGLAVRSWRSGSAGASIQKAALGDIIAADIFVADVTTSNPNVMYELGVRHAANRGPTLLLRGSPAPTPFYAGYLQAVLYDPQADLDRPDAIRERLSGALRAAARRTEGSPVYEFFPGLRVELPEELRLEHQQARAYPPRLKQALEAAGSRGSRVPRGDAKAVEELIGASGEVSPTAYLDLLRLHRDAGNWDALIRAYDTLPPEVASDPQVLQLLALALNRRAREGDQERAVAVMRRLVEESGGDAETFAILGRIYKDRWKEGADAGALDAAIDCYRHGFELQPTDLYSGFNAASLMFLRGDSPHDGDLAALLPQVERLAQDQIAGDPWDDYWVISIALELAVIERDWTRAEEYVARALEKHPDAFARSASVESLQRLKQQLRGEDAVAVGRLVDRLRLGATAETGDYA